MKTITAIIMTIITICLLTMPAAAEVVNRGEYYPRLSVVTACERVGDSDLWVIICTDKNGEQWAFYGEEEDAHIGNIYNLLMINMGEDEEADEIVDAFFEGRMDDHVLRDWLNGNWQ